jgi:hypothetical protein
MGPTPARRREVAGTGRGIANAVSAVVVAALFVIPPLVLAAFGAGALGAYARCAQRLLGQVASEEATHYLGTPVYVERITLHEKRIEARGVRVVDPTRRSGEDLAGADRVLVPLHGDLIQRWRDGDRPLADVIQVTNAHAEVRRDRQGRWNFSSLFRTAKGPPGRNWIGQITLYGLTVKYRDEALPALPGRQRSAVALEAVGRDATFAWDDPGSMAWSADIRLCGGNQGHVWTSGRYDSQRRAWYVNVASADLLWPCTANRFLPAGFGVEGVRISGGVLLASRIGWSPLGPNPKTRPELPLRITASARLTGGQVQTPWLRSSVSLEHAEMNLQDATVQARAVASAFGGRLEAYGTVLGLNKPQYTADLSGSDLAIGQVLREIRLLGNVPARVRKWSGRGSAWAQIVGSGASAQLVGVARAKVSGPVVTGVNVAKPITLTANVWGPVRKPTVRVGAVASTIKARGEMLQNIRVSGLLRDGLLEVSGDGSVAGGTAGFQGRMRLNDVGSYRGSLALRGASACRLVDAVQPWLPPGTVAQPSVGNERLRNVQGAVSADVLVFGDRRQTVKSARMLVQVLGARLDNIEVDEAELAARIAGDRANVERLFLRRGAAVGAAAGVVNLRDVTGSINVEAEGWSLAEIVRWSGTSPDRPVQGVFSLRSGLVSGDLRRPDVRGTLYARDLRWGDWGLDYAVAAIEGTENSVTVDGEAVRVPSVTTFNGHIRRPFSRSPWLSVGADIQDIDVGEIASTAGVETPLSGFAGGSLFLEGPVSRVRAPEVHLSSDQLWIGEGALDAVSLTGGLAVTERGVVGDVRTGSARIGTGWLTGSGRFDSDGAFHASVHAQQVPLEVLNNLSNGYADVRGTAEAGVDLAGHRDRDGDMQLTGAATFNTEALLVNGENLGDLRFRALIRGKRIESESASDGPALHWGSGDTGLAVDRFQYDLDTRRFDAVVRTDGLRVESVRRAFERSPAVMSGASGERVASVLRALTPLRGALGAKAAVAGTPDEWVARIAFDGSGMAIDQLTADTFTGSVEATNRQITVRGVELRSGDAVATADGELRFGESVRGTVTAQELDFGLLSQWLPVSSPLRSLAGVLDSVTAELAGKPDEPEVNVSMSARGVAYRTEASGSGVRSGWSAPAIRLSSAAIREGLLSVDDLAVTISGSGSGNEGNPLELHASGRIPFSWKPPYIADDAVGDVAVRLPQTDLRALQSLFAGDAIDMRGSAAAEVRAQGTRTQFERIASGEADPTDTLNISGEAWLKADRIRVLRMRTALGDVDLRAVAGDGKVTIGPSTGNGPVARVQTLDTRSEAASESGQVFLSGSLAIAGAGSAADRLRLRIPELRFDEAPFPGFSTGRIAGVLTGPGGVGLSSGGAQMDIAGSILEPQITGQAELQKASIRLPVTEGASRMRRSIPAINPSFDVRLKVANGTTVRNNQLNVALGSPEGNPIRLTGTLGEPRLSGLLAVQNGSLTFPTARFAIQRGGSVTLRYPASGAADAEDAGLEVLVDVTAQARLSAESVTGQMRRYLITVAAKGPLMDAGNDPTNEGSGKLKLTYRSDPPDLALSQEGMARRVTALLGGQDALNAVFSRHGDAGSVLVGKVVDYLGGALMPDLVDQAGVGRALGLNELSVDYSRVGAFVLRLSRDLGGPFEIGYWKHITGARDAFSDAGDWEFRLGVRLRDRFRLSWTVNDQRTNVYRLEGVYSF